MVNGYYKTMTEKYKQSWENFDILAILGIGLFGKVKLAKWITENNKPCAIKVVSKKNALRLGKASHLTNEKEVLLSLDHPFIVKWYQFIVKIVLVHFRMRIMFVLLWSMLQVVNYMTL